MTATLKNSDLSYGDSDMQLKNPDLLKDKSYIDGQWVAGGKTFNVTNPADGSLVAQVADLGVEETKEAIAVAEKAMPEWAARSAKERGAILRRWADLMVEHEDDLAMIMTVEQGKPLAEAVGEIKYATSFVEWFAEEGKRAYGDVVPSSIPGARIIVTKQPIGVCATITPWNFPSAMITRKVAAALAAGCTVVSRPASETPLSALALVVLAEQAGVPPGVINMITGLDARGIGLELCENPTIKKLSFTGSTEVGKILMKQCAGTMKKLSLELGGNAPFIIFEDADVEDAVDGIIACKIRNAGQTCISANRIYVHEDIYDELAEKLAAQFKELKIGDGREEGVRVGPLMNEAAVKKVEDHVQDAQANGATVLAGGKAADLGGLYYEPTVLTGMTNDMKISCEETFGPLAPLFKFKDEDEVVKLANDTIYGLASYFYTNDLGRVWRVSEALEYGMVAVNAGTLSSEAVPFGGVKESGIGREGSKYGLDEYMEIKYTLMAGLNK